MIDQAAKRKAYFSPETIQAKSLEMQKQLKTFRQQHRQRLHPDQAALLVLDMQAYFLDLASHAFVPSAPAIIAGVNRLSKAFGKQKRPVIFTRHLNTKREAGMMGGWWRNLIQEGDPLSEIDPRMENPSGKVLTKSQYDAFHGSGLEERLQAKKVSQVVICGVMTHLCCESTARAAFVRGFGVFFTIDGTATYDEKFHMATLRNLAHGVAVPVRVEEIAAPLEGNNGR